MWRSLFQRGAGGCWLIWAKKSPFIEQNVLWGSTVTHICQVLKQRFLSVVSGQQDFTHDQSQIDVKKKAFLLRAHKYFYHIMEYHEQLFCSVPEALCAKGTFQFFCVKCLSPCIRWQRPSISAILMCVPESFRCCTVAQGMQSRTERGWRLELLKWFLTRWHGPWLSAMPNWTARNSKHWPNVLLLVQQSCIYLIWQSETQLHFKLPFLNLKPTSNSWEPHTLQLLP